MQPKSFLDSKLAHATPEHIHSTSLSRFIGPLPKGWLNTNEKRLSRFRTNYHRQNLDFNADEAVFDQIHSWSACPRWMAEAEQTKMTARHRKDDSQSTMKGSCGAADSTAKASIPETLAEVDPAERLELARGASTRQGLVGNLDVPKDTSIEAGPAAANQVNDTYCDLLAETQNTYRGAIAFQRGSSDGSQAQIQSPRDTWARESSTISAETFMTAPEALPDPQTTESTLNRGQTPSLNAQASARSAASYENDSDSESDASTIRPNANNTETQSELTETDTAAAALQPAVDIGELTEESTTGHSYDNGESQRFQKEDASISFDANSRTLLLHANEQAQNTSGPMRKDVKNLVHFDDVDTGMPHTSLTPNQNTCQKSPGHGKKYFTQRRLRNLFHKPRGSGELLGAERVLLKIESTRQSDLPGNYSDGYAQRVPRRTKLHWREFIVAAHENDDGHTVLSFFRNRTIPIISKDFAKTNPSKQVVLDPRTTHANLYSSLDKSIIIWSREKRDTVLFILLPQATHSSIEWYAFIQTKLNIKPRNFPIISVPSLNMKLHIDLRGEHAQLASAVDAAAETTAVSSSQSSDSGDSIIVNDDGLLESAGVVITGDYLMDTCWRVLSQQPGIEPVMKDWQDRNRMGFCWRRYDRLEWIHGHNARQLVGQWAMQATHELELRPKEHYATELVTESGKTVKEPAPLEGFLVRLTSSLGRQARFGKVFYKRLYFSTHDHLLFYASPSRATPPPPPGFQFSEVDTLAAAEAPLVFDVDPVPLTTDTEIADLSETASKERAAARNHIAMLEAARRVNTLEVSDGFIDLLEVVQVRRWRSSPDDTKNNISHASDAVDFHAEDSNDDNLLPDDVGTTEAFDDERVFELVLRNGLVVRLQAYNGLTRQLWMEDLVALIRYWALKKRSDGMELHEMRRANLEALHIDEEVESIVGQYGTKWEVSRCISEPRIYNFCPLSACRTIAHRGLLYRKSSVHSTFKKFECVISNGQLTVYHHLHWTAAGDQERHIHHSKHERVELRECYIYSGTSAETELIGARETSDREGPGRHTLPRLYGDGWTAQDEQEALSFVIWTGRRRVAFRMSDKDDSEKNSVSRLGVSGRSTIFMARSRQERDHWVQVLKSEIQRCLATS